MPTKSLYSIFKENEKITSKNAKIKHLRENYTPAMGIVLEFTYNNLIRWLLPEGDPPYKKNETPWDNQGQLHHEVRRFYLFTDGPSEAQKNLKQIRREQLFVDMLENLPAEEAEILLGMKDRRLPFKGLTKKFVMECFGGLSKDWE
tara:strand:- start:848 stop:1285 length:438 start_codon:yes stop_codon:yes gene_type:complete